jgi:alkylation response protein AidB-like acyl-CoA dehydrogenase
MARRSSGAVTRRRRYHRRMFTRSDDQQLFEETTRRFLEIECPLDKVRELSVTPSGYEPAFWQKGAELGWTSLVVPEEAGGGSVSDQGVRDLALVAFQFGQHAAPGPLLGSNVVAAALGRWGNDAQQAGPLAELLRGEAVGAWALAEPPPDDALGQIALEATRSEGGFTLHGAKTPVEAAMHATYVLVTARDGAGLSQFLVPSGTDGMHVSPLNSLDMTRKFGRVEFDRARLPQAWLVGEAGEAGDAVGWLTDLAVTVQLAEMCGAMTWAFDTTLAWTFNRYAFGRPLASYQEIKHRFADMKLWLEASLAITAQAADAVGRDTPDRSEVVSAGKSYVGRYGVELLQDCVQMHGGIGITFDHHLHLFLRRVSVNTPLFGTPGQHAARLTTLFEAKEATR